MALVVTYLGQGSLSLKSTESQTLGAENSALHATAAISIAVDPTLSLTDSHSVTPTDADYILQTQGSAEQLHDALEYARRSEATVICHAETAVWFKQNGIQNVHGMKLGSGVNFPFGKLIMTLAHQAGAMVDGASGLNSGGYASTAFTGAPVSYLVHFNDGFDLYIAGNSAQTADMELIGKAGGVDLAILPLGDQPYKGSDDALRAAQLVQAKHVLPLRHAAAVPVGAPVVDEGDILAERLRRVAEIDTTVLQPGEEALF